MINISRMLGLLQPLEVVEVQLKTGHTIQGALVHRDREHLILRAARIGAIEPGTRAEVWNRLDGETIIPVSNVDFYTTALDASILE